MAVRIRSKRWLVAACVVVAAAVVGAFVYRSGASTSGAHHARTRQASAGLVSRRIRHSGAPALVAGRGRAGRRKPLPFHLSSVAPSAAQLLAGAPTPPPGWTSAVHTVDQGGLLRSYLTVQPSHLSTPVPVVVLMHGRFMTADQILGYTRLASSVGPAIIIAPQGYERSWNAGGCCGPAWKANVNDVALVVAALDSTFASTPMADRSRVFAVGFSNGGRMAYRLACDMPGVFTGFAAVEAVPVVPCSSMQPVDVTVVAQQGDPLLTTKPGALPKRIDGTTEPTLPVELARLRALDGCASSGQVTKAGVSVITTWSCGSGTTLRYVWYPGGRHSWRPSSGTTPGATPVVVAMIRSSHDLVS